MLITKEQQEALISNYIHKSISKKHKQCL